MSSSNLGDVIGKLLPEVHPSKVKISGARGIFCQEYPILCDFENIFVPGDLAPASQIVSHTVCVWRLNERENEALGTGLTMAQLI